jgi:hypothetical protein
VKREIIRGKDNLTKTLFQIFYISSALNYKSIAVRYQLKYGDLHEDTNESSFKGLKVKANIKVEIF